MVRIMWQFTHWIVSFSDTSLFLLSKKKCPSNTANFHILLTLEPDCFLQSKAGIKNKEHKTRTTRLSGVILLTKLKGEGSIVG